VHFPELALRPSRFRRKSLSETSWSGVLCSVKSGASVPFGSAAARAVAFWSTWLLF
jgi:hypothetical protein